MARHKIVNLALQGGGAHGAFTWGVLDALLEDGRVDFEGITGTSAGAMNAVVMAHGLAQDGRSGARAALQKFWHKVADIGEAGPVHRSPLDQMKGQWRLDGLPGYVWFDVLSRLLSPYQFNPFNWNPLRGVLDDLIDYDMLRTSATVKLFINATHVRSGKIKVFEKEDLSTDVLMASACLPFLFQTVWIDGEPYWDGGYMGNPALFPVIYGCTARDVVIVQINPLYREQVPVSARDILDRAAEISFNSSLMREMRAVHFISRLIEGEQLDGSLYKSMLIHMIEDEQTLESLGASSKLAVDRPFVDYLFSIGRAAGQRWLAAHFDALGQRSTVDLVKTFM